MNMHTQHVSPPDESVLADYLAGRLVPAERVRVDQWLDAERSRRETLQALRYVALYPTERPAPEDVAKLRTAFWASVRQWESSIITATHSSEQGRRAERMSVGDPSRTGVFRNVGVSRFGARTLQGFAIGAAAVLGTVAIILARGDGAAVPTGQQRVYETGVGQRATLSLVDGSSVTLAPHSRLVISSGFARSNRTLSLEGEGYFTVRGAAGLPFTVRTGYTTTRVLGTEFGVRRYAEDSVTRIVVVSGKVMADTRNARATITSGSVGILTDSTATTAIADDVGRYSQWLNGRIVFDETPVPAMLTTLSRWYGYEFRLADSALAHEVMTGEFHADALEETLKTLKNVLGVELTFDKQTIILRSTRASTPAPTRVGGSEIVPHSMEIGK
jgi:transmembrane sensor